MKKIKRISFILAIMLILTFVVACGDNGEDKGNNKTEEQVEVEKDNTEFPLEIEDEFGKKIKLENAPERIISLAPNNTEILFALGLGDKVVGVTSFDNYPEKVLEIEKIGDYEGHNLEKVIELEPDLVLSYGAGDEEEIARLEEAGINVLGYLPESIDEVIETIENIGIATGTSEEAEKIKENMLSKKEEIVNKVKDEEKVKVFYEIWHDPLQAAGPGSFMDELIILSAGENIASDADSAYAEYDIEQLIERNPDVYITADEGDKTVDEISERPGYEEINAIKNGKIYLLDGDIVSRAGPRIIEALELVARSIHPELFE